MLAHIGVVTLPQDTVDKLYTGMPLTQAEVAMVERVPAFTRRLVRNIPRLEGVLEILDTYCVPDHGAKDATTPAPPGALVLRVAVDYEALESQGTTAPVACAAMSSRGLYDTELMSALAAVAGVGKNASSVHEVTIADLEIGMRLADDVCGQSGRLLVARGQRVTAHMIERLANLRSRGVREPLRVFESAAD